MFISLSTFQSAASFSLRGAAEALAEAGAVLLGGHSVRDAELKLGLAVILAVPPTTAPDLLEAMLASGHRAAEIGEVMEGSARIEVV